MTDTQPATAHASSSRPDPVIAGIVLFCLAHMLIRLFGSPNLSVDETETIIHTQVFSLFYKLNNPPLYDWMVWAVAQVTGPGLLAAQLVKTALIAGGGVFLCLAALPALRHRSALAAAMVAYGASAFYGWDLFQQFSHTNALVFSLGFTLWALMRLLRYRRTRDYIWLGVALGLGLLSKYLFGLTFAALLIAALRPPVYRRALLDPRLLLTVGVGLVVLSPLAIGYWDSADAVYDALGQRVAGSRGGPDLRDLGLLAALSTEYWLPFTLLLALSLWRRPAMVPVAEPPNGEGDPDFYPLLRNATILMVVALLLAVFVLGTNVKGGRFLAPVLTYLPLTIFAVLDRRHNFPGEAVRLFTKLGLGLIVVVAIARLLIFLFTAPSFCVPRCVVFVDYEPVIAALEIEDAAAKQIVVITDDLHIGANLIPRLDNGWVIYPPFTKRLNLDIAPASDRVCRFVWFERYGGDDKRKGLRRAMKRALGRAPTKAEQDAVLSVETVIAGWHTWLLAGTAPDNEVGVATLDSTSPLCGGDIADQEKARSKNGASAPAT